MTLCLIYSFHPFQVFFTVAYHGYVNHWTINVTGDPEEVAERTLCIREPTVEVESLTVTAFSNLDEPIKFNITAFWTDFVIDISNNSLIKELELTPTTPQSLKYEIPVHDYYHFYELHISSKENKCMYVSINPGGQCYGDAFTTWNSSKLWSRVIHEGYFQIRPREFGGSIIVSMLPLKDSKECYSRGLQDLTESDKKIVTLKLTRMLGSYTTPIAVTTVFIFLFCVTTFLVWCLSWRWQRSYNTKVLERQQSSLELARLESTRQTDRTQPTTIHTDRRLQPKQITVSEPESVSREDRMSKNIGVHVRFAGPSGDTENAAANEESDLREELCKLLKKIPSTKTKAVIQRLNHERLTVSDTSTLIEKDSFFRRNRSKNFYFLLPLVSLFYLLPAAQMVWHEQRRSRESGNLEMCYLNYGCARPLGVFSDFNHVISNCGYVIYGVVFIILVKVKTRFLLYTYKEGYMGVRSFRPRNTLVVNEQLDILNLGNRGIPQQHALFYCMGLCMIFQGLFSAVFHTCPSDLSLQFDTTIMYVMLSLVFIKTYQFRHPDCSYVSYNVMYSLVVLLALESISLYITDTAGKLVFYSIFSLGYFFYLLYVLIDEYFYGALDTSFPKFVPPIYEMVFHKKGILYPKRFFFLCLVVLLNVVLLAWVLYRSLDEGPKSLSTPALVFLAANSMTYLVVYMGNKFVEIWHSQEGKSGRGWKSRRVMRSLSFVLLLFVLIFGAFAGYFYMSKLQSRSSTPAESRYYTVLYCCFA